MNFDDLHDPDPPRPSSATLAAVAGRARQIRRRRTALVAGGAILAAAAVVVPTALVVTGDDAGDRMVPATAPETPPPTVPATTVPATTVPATTLPESPTTPAATTTPAPATTAIPSLAPTTVAPPVGPAVVAVRADGDAVSIDGAGVETVLYDSFDVPDPAIEGGDSATADGIAVTGDGRQFVSLCCEPVAGTWFEVGAEEAVRYGHDLDVSPDGTRLAVAGGSFTAVYAPDGTILAEADVSASPVYTQLEQAMWLDDDTLALLAYQESGEFRLLTVDATLGDVDPMAGGVLPALPSPEAAWPELAGVGTDGSILVIQRTGDGLQYASATLEAYDPETLERRPASDIGIPAPAIFAWYADGLLTWVGEDHALHVGDAVVPGEFFWARPVS